MAQDDIDRLLKILQVTPLGDDVFEGHSTTRNRPRVFGGQVLAQALYAAYADIPADRCAHSLHAYFLRPGDTSIPIHYKVEAIRDGRSFNTRIVSAHQNDKTIFHSTISFHVDEGGPAHQQAMPDVPAPEELETELEFWARMIAKYPDVTEPRRMAAIEQRDCEAGDIYNNEAAAAEADTWFRILGDVTAYAGSDAREVLRLQQCLLAFVSDIPLLNAGLRPHGVTVWEEGTMFASLDHSIWFHHTRDVQNWHLFHYHSPQSGNARALCHGEIYTRDGTLCASVAQETLFRLT